MFLNCSYIYFQRKLYFIGLSLGVYFHERGKGKDNGNSNTLKNVKSTSAGICKHSSFDLRKCLEPNLSFLSLQNFYWQL